MQALPERERNVPLFVLSAILVAIGAILALGLANLLPNSDPIVGNVRIVVYAFTVAGFGMGGAYMRLSLTDRTDALFWALFAPGSTSFLVSMTTGIIFSPSFQAIAA